MLSAALIALSFTASAFGAVFITSPTATTTFVGGQNATISWQDSGSAPSLAQFGPSKVSIYAGNAQQQTLLQQIAPNVDVSKVSAIVFVPNPQIGPNSPQYFIRFESLSLKDATNPQYPALAFSAKYAMSGMTGQFTPAVQAQINGQATAPLAGGVAASSTPAALPTTTSAASSSMVTLTSTKASSTSSTAKPSSSGSASQNLVSAGSIGVAGIFVFLLNFL